VHGLEVVVSLPCGQPPWFDTEPIVYRYADPLPDSRNDVRLATRTLARGRTGTGPVLRPAEWQNFAHKRWKSCEGDHPTNKRQWRLWSFVRTVAISVKRVGRGAGSSVQMTRYTEVDDEDKAIGVPVTSSAKRSARRPFVRSDNGSGLFGARPSRWRSGYVLRQA
jgi:hypothetical protein